jgi:hypothetical protein
MYISGKSQDTKGFRNHFIQQGELLKSFGWCLFQASNKAIISSESTPKISSLLQLVNTALLQNLCQG